MPQTLSEMRAEYKTLTTRVDEIFTAEGDDAKIPAEMKQEIITANKRREELQVAINDTEKETAEMATLRQQQAAAKAWLARSSGNMRHETGGGNADVLGADGSVIAPEAAGYKSLADEFMGSDAIKSWHAMTHPAGMPTPEKSHVESPHVRLKDFSLKTLVTSNTTPTGRYSNTTGGALVQPQVLDMVALPFRPLRLRDVVTVINATSPLIEYPKVTGYTNNAAAVAEATDTTGNTGVKPESALALILGTSIASTIAHWMPVTRQALSDAPQLRDLMETFLGNGLNQAVEDAMITGSGSTPNLQGITTLPGVSAQAFVTNILTTTRKAITKAQTSPIFVEPNAFLLSPADWEAIDLSADNEYRYYYGGPSQTGTPRLWGKPVVVSQAVQTGVGWTGDLKTLVLADLQEAQMYITDSHSNWFVANLLAILMELRLHFFALRPAAVIKMALA